LFVDNSITHFFSKVKFHRIFLICGILTCKRPPRSSGNNSSCSSPVISPGGSLRPGPVASQIPARASALLRRSVLSLCPFLTCPSPSPSSFFCFRRASLGRSRDQQEHLYPPEIKDPSHEANRVACLTARHKWGYHSAGKILFIPNRHKKTPSLISLADTIIPRSGQKSRKKRRQGIPCLLSSCHLRTVCFNR